MSLQQFEPFSEDTCWMERLRPGHYIYLFKQKHFAQIELPWYPPDPGCLLGKIVFRNIYTLNPRTYGTIESWWVSGDGLGFDQTRLILPVRNNLPDFPDPVEQPVIRDLRLEIAKLRSEVDQLKMIISECNWR